MHVHKHENQIGAYKGEGRQDINLLLMKLHKTGATIIVVVRLHTPTNPKTEGSQTIIQQKRFCLWWQRFWKIFNYNFMQHKHNKIIWDKRCHHTPTSATSTQKFFTPCDEMPTHKRIKNYLPHSSIKQNNLLTAYSFNTVSFSILGNSRTSGSATRVFQDSC